MLVKKLATKFVTLIELFEPSTFLEFCCIKGKIKSCVNILRQIQNKCLGKPSERKFIIIITYHHTNNFNDKERPKKLLRTKACNVIKKRPWHWRFPVNFVKFLRAIFSIEHLRWLLLVFFFWLTICNSRKCFVTRFCLCLTSAKMLGRNRSSPPEVFEGKGVRKIRSTFTGEHPCQNFNKVTKQLYCNHTSTWVFPCKFAAYFDNTFL